jgi:O-antigen/teichoic acid export membrane protein
LSDHSYRRTFKATSIFAGVQVIIILVALVKSKLIAVWLGPAGFGLMSLFNSVITMIYSISNLGLSSSGVRDIAACLDEKDMLAKTVISFKRWALGTGLFGALFTIIFSPVLSKLSFGSYSYTLSFVFLSIVVLLNGLSYINLAIIQGSHNIKLLAKSNILAAIAGLTISIPLFYFMGTKAIALSIVLTALILFLSSNYFLGKTNLFLKKIELNYSETWRIGLNSVKLGIMISISFIVLTIVEFIIKTYITRKSGLDIVGLYQAGWTLNTTYLGLVFTAMATDFFPRLSAVATNDSLVKRDVNQQAEVALLILGPMIVLMIVSLPLLIKLLYSVKFSAIIAMTRFLLIGSLFKAGSWAISFIFLAKGNGKLYLFNEIGVKCITLPTYLLFFHFMGLDGIGYAFIADQTIYFIWVSVAAKIKYGFVYSYEYFKILFIIFSLSLLSIFSVNNLFSHVSFVISIFCIICIFSYSLYKINDKIDLIALIKSRMFFWVQ